VATLHFNSPPSALLGEVGIKSNPYREAIIEEMRTCKDHPTAEILFERLQTKYPELSFATVYNNLNLFLEKGILTRFFSKDRQAIYDFGDEPHHHLVCRSCGKVEDIEMTHVDLMLKRCPGTWKLERSEAFFHGLCEKCSNELVVTP
jgi:Fe2+ or Zn2+ uptake regulation protein